MKNITIERQHEIVARVAQVQKIDRKTAELEILADVERLGKGFWKKLDQSMKRQGL